MVRDSSWCYFKSFGSPRVGGTNLEFPVADLEFQVADVAFVVFFSLRCIYCKRLVSPDLEKKVATLITIYTLFIYKCQNYRCMLSVDNLRDVSHYQRQVRVVNVESVACR